MAGLFGYTKPRKTPRVIAHMIDTGVSDFVGGHLCAEFECKKCGWNSGWLHGFETVTSVKRGIACEFCNTEKAISINQPWAWAIVNGHKDIENRNWRTTFRGKVLIHAGKKFDRDGYEFIKHNFPALDLPSIEEFKNKMAGGIVGSAEIIDCVNHSDSAWYFGPHGFVLINAAPYPLRACKGALGFFQPDYNSRYKE